MRTPPKKLAVNLLQQVACHYVRVRVRRMIVARRSTCARAHAQAHTQVLTYGARTPPEELVLQIEAVTATVMP